MPLDERDARAVLRVLDCSPEAVVPLEGGAWSSAFAVRTGESDLVLRLGGSSEDYAADAAAASLNLPAVPIPQVLAWGTEDGLTYALTEYVPGDPLESVTAATWAALVPQLADVLEALRATGPGGPGTRRLRGEPQLLHDHPHELIKVGRSSASTQAAADGLPTQPTRAFIEPGLWRRHLLGVGNYPWHAGWGARADADAVEMFEVVRRRLGDLAVDDAPMSLLHADWINRNVHVLDGRISGIFDWGCSRFGDHLYDLAWFEFLAPWHPNLDVPLLRHELESRWDAAGVAPLRHPDRRLACLLHIGLDHIVYHVLHGTPADLHATMDRLADYL